MPTSMDIDVTSTLGVFFWLVAWLGSEWLGVYRCSTRHINAMSVRVCGVVGLDICAEFCWLTES